MGDGVGTGVKFYPRVLFFIFLALSTHAQQSLRSADFRSVHTITCFRNGCVQLQLEYSPEVNVSTIKSVTYCHRGLAASHQSFLSSLDLHQLSVSRHLASRPEIHHKTNTAHSPLNTCK